MEDGQPFISDGRSVSFRESTTRWRQYYADDVGGNAVSNPCEKNVAYGNTIIGEGSGIGSRSGSTRDREHPGRFGRWGSEPREQWSCCLWEKETPSPWSSSLSVVGDAAPNIKVSANGCSRFGSSGGVCVGGSTRDVRSISAGCENVKPRCGPGGMTTADDVRLAWGPRQPQQQAPPPSRVDIGWKHCQGQATMCSALADGGRKEANDSGPAADIGNNNGDDAVRDVQAWEDTKALVRAEGTTDQDRRYWKPVIEPERGNRRSAGAAWSLVRRPQTAKARLTGATNLKSPSSRARTARGGAEAMDTRRGGEGGGARGRSNVRPRVQDNSSDDDGGLIVSDTRDFRNERIARVVREKTDRNRSRNNGRFLASSRPKSAPPGKEEARRSISETSHEALRRGTSLTSLRKARVKSGWHHVRTLNGGGASGDLRGGRSHEGMVTAFEAGRGTGMAVEKSFVWGRSSWVKGFPSTTTMSTARVAGSVSVYSRRRE